MMAVTLFIETAVGTISIDEMGETLISTSLIIGIEAEAVVIYLSIKKGDGDEKEEKI